MIVDRVLAKQRPSHGPPPIPGAENAAGRAEKPQPLRVLLVDDEPLIRWSLGRGLNRRGHDVREATTAAEALALIASDGPFDAVVLDYRLPDRRDLSLLRDVLEVSPSTTVVMMTAYGEPGMRDQARALGALAVVDKPFQVADLIALIESV